MSKKYTGILCGVGLFGNLSIPVRFDRSFRTDIKLVELFKIFSQNPFSFNKRSRASQTLDAV